MLLLLHVTVVVALDGVILYVKFSVSPTSKDKDVLERDILVGSDPGVTVTVQ